MVEIIKRGTRKTCTCNECGCVFKFNDEDIETIEKETLFLYGIEGHTLVKSITCPQCGKEIILSQPKGV